MPNGWLILNDYQQLMVRLSGLSPYNAVHSVLMQGENISLDALAHSINHVVEKLGIGVPLFSNDGKRVSFETCIPKLQRCSLSLIQHIDHEMNYRFEPDEPPCRFFIINDERCVYFSMTYNHWVADAYAISRLIESIFAHLCNKTVPHLSLHVPKMQTCFNVIYGKWAFYYRTLHLVKSTFRFSRAFRTPVSDYQETACGHSMHVFGPALFLQLNQFCKENHVTLNDLFITILARLFGKMTEEQRAHLIRKRFKLKRNRIIIAVIANIRTQSSVPLSTVFSLFLGFFYLSFRSPERLSFAELSQKVKSKTKRLKKNQAALKESLIFKVQNFILARKKNKNSQYRLFTKNSPITVGISNLDLRPIESDLLQNVHHYIRFSPTAMVCPIVFNLSTFNQHLSLGITFRKACYTRDQVEEMKEKFVAEISQLLPPIEDNHSSQIGVSRFYE